MASSGISTVRKSSRRPTPKRTRVLILAASPVVRLGLERLLEREPEMELVPRIESETEFVASIAQHKPEVVCVQGKIEILERASDSLKAVAAPVIWLTEHIDKSSFLRALDMGVSGILHTESLATELSSAVQAAAGGLSVFSIQVLETLRPSLQQPSQEAHPDSDAANQFIEELTAREHEVLEMMMEGFSNKEIALQINVSLHTVKFHISSILAKLGANSRTEATTIGLRHGLITI
jgi:DNA-binding NarL/FixJ family response regulator